jgi:hypothetical protein
VSICAALTALPGAEAGILSQNAPVRPNVVVILADDAASTASAVCRTSSG